LSDGQKRPAVEVRPIAEALLALLRPHLVWGEIAGSLRRERAEVGDIEIVATALPSYFAFMDELVVTGTGKKALYGEKQTTRWGEKYRGLDYQGMKCEIFLCDDWNRGYLWFLRTGPGNPADNANAYLVTKIKNGNAPFRVSEGYVYQGDQKLKIATEQDWFALCGLPFIEPRTRSVKAYAKHFSKAHQWGNPSAYKIRQQKMFDLSLYFDAPIMASGQEKPPKPPRQKFVWSAPWLRTDGKVWVYVGYGEWTPMEMTSSRAKLYFEQLDRMAQKQRGIEGKRLFAFVDLRRIRERRDVMANVLSVAAEILRA